MTNQPTDTTFDLGQAGRIRVDGYFRSIKVIKSTTPLSSVVMTIDGGESYTLASGNGVNLPEGIDKPTFEWSAQPGESITIALDNGQRLATDQVTTRPLPIDLDELAASGGEFYSMLYRDLADTGWQQYGELLEGETLYLDKVNLFTFTNMDAVSFEIRKGSDVIYTTGGSVTGSLYFEKKMLEGRILKVTGPAQFWCMAEAGDIEISGIKYTN